MCVEHHCGHSARVTELEKRCLRLRRDGPTKLSITTAARLPRPTPAVGPPKVYDMVSYVRRTVRSRSS